MPDEGLRRFVFVRAAALALVTLVLAGAIAGCGSDGSNAGMEEGTLDDLPELELEEVLRIGDVDDPDVGFSSVGQVKDGSNGWVWVMENQAQELRAYSAEGELVRVLGGRGEGPGEFGRMQGFGVHGDTVWAYDFGLRRLTRFGPDGQVLSTAPVEDVRAPLHAPGEEVRFRPGPPDPDGRFVGIVDLRFVGQGDPVRDSVDVPIVRFGADGQVIDTAGWHPRFASSGSPERISPGQSTFTVPRPPPMTPIRDYTATDQITVEREAVGDEPVVRLVRQALSGDTVRVRAFAIRTKPFPDDYLDSLAVQSAHVTGTLVTFEDGEIETLERHAADTAAARTQIRAAMDFPEVQPPVQRIHLTSEGAVWLERERMGDGWQRWVVLSPDDEPVGRFRLPTGVRLSRADSEGFWAVEQDEFDIPWVVRYRFVEPGESAGL